MRVGWGKAAARRNGCRAQPASGGARACGQPRRATGVRRAAVSGAPVATTGRARFATPARRGGAPWRQTVAPCRSRGNGVSCSRPSWAVWSPAAPAQTSGLRLGPWHRVWRVRPTRSGQRPPRERRHSSSIHGSRWTRSGPVGGMAPSHGIEVGHTRRTTARIRAADIATMRTRRLRRMPARTTDATAAPTRHARRSRPGEAPAGEGAADRAGMVSLG